MDERSKEISLKKEGLDDDGRTKLLDRRRASQTRLDETPATLTLKTSTRKEDDDSGVCTPDCLISPDSELGGKSKTSANSNVNGQLFRRLRTMEEQSCIDEDEYDDDDDDDDNYDDETTSDPQSAYYSVAPSASWVCEDFRIRLVADELAEWLSLLMDSDLEQTLEEILDETDLAKKPLIVSETSLSEKVELVGTENLEITRTSSLEDNSLITLRVQSSSKSVEWRRLQGQAYVAILELKKSEKRIVYYLYPDLVNVIGGHFEEEVRLSRGVHGKLKHLIYHLNVPFPAVTISNGPVLKEDVSSAVHLSSYPLLRDPMEMDRVYVAASQLEDAGEGLFARTFIHQEELAALFNGVRVRDVDIRVGTFTDYKLMLNSDLCLDIPPKMTDVHKYRATLGHKASHAFEPNCVFVQLWHPRFGLIMALRALRGIARNEEITVNYNYELSTAPSWYVNLFFEHLRYNEQRSEQFIFDYVRRWAKLNSRSMLHIPPPKINSDRFCECQLCSQHVSLQHDRVQCDQCLKWTHLNCYTKQQQPPHVREANMQVWQCRTCDT